MKFLVLIAIFALSCTSSSTPKVFSDLYQVNWVAYKKDRTCHQIQREIIFRMHHMNNWKTIFKTQFNKAMKISTISSATPSQSTENKIWNRCEIAIIIVFIKINTKNWEFCIEKEKIEESELPTFRSNEQYGQKFINLVILKISVFQLINLSPEKIVVVKFSQTKLFNADRFF